jgi:hypothetical protein
MSRVIPLYQHVDVFAGGTLPALTTFNSMLPTTAGQFGNAFSSTVDWSSGRLARVYDASAAASIVMGGLSGGGALATVSLTYGKSVGSNSTALQVNSSALNAAIASTATGLLTAANLRLDNGASSLVSARTATDSADDQALLGNVLLAVASRLQAFDGATYDRLRSLPDNADDQAPLAASLLAVLSRLQAFDGTNFDRLRVQSAANVSAATQTGVVLAAAPGNWSINHTPAANTQATITRAAGGAGVRHVCTSISCTLIGRTAAAETEVLVNLRDGATGAGTILWSQRLQVIPGGTTGLALSHLQIPGSANTAMTWEFEAAGGADTFESVAVTGYDVV